MPPVRAAQQSQSQQCKERSGWPNDPALTRSRFPSQHFLDKSFAARHLVEALLIRRDPPYFVIRQGGALMASSPFPGIELVDLALKTRHVPRRAFVRVALARAEKALQAESRSFLDCCGERLIGRGIDDQPKTRCKRKHEHQRHHGTRGDTQARAPLCGTGE